MRLISVNLRNFASYKEMAFDFTSQGLTLISGATGSGKSTLCDAIPWILFGVTAKGGKVDEILSWPGDEITIGTIHLLTCRGNIWITRVRGKAKDNDLYYINNLSAAEKDLVDYDTKLRGKDLNDTQKLINNLLGMDAELFLAGAYYHEFSQTAQFFTTTAKNRRTICEQLVDLSLATKLQAQTKDKEKELNKELQILNQSMALLDAEITQLKRLQEAEKTKATKWEESHRLTIAMTKERYNLFEQNRRQIISKKCRTCGTVLEKPHEHVNTDPNPNLEYLAELELTKNPHTGSIKDFSSDINEKLSETSLTEHKQTKVNKDLSDLEQLSDIVDTYRSVSITNTIQYIETQTNKLLTDHFDAECKVNFTVESADKLDVAIHKDGNLASYTQLSKGQRCMLKLCFGVSVMKAAQNHHGLSFNIAMFDEALDGLSDSLKLKAIGLLETLTQSTESVFLVEHSESIKAMVNNRYQVELVNGHSEIEKV
jgi:DNA repair exonuclease SbcCD ATPase subunit